MTPIFFRITVGLFAALLVFGAAIVLLLVLNMESINRSGGWGWLLAAALFVVAATVVCSAGAACAVVSLWRGEGHRRLSIALLIGSCLVVWAFGPNVVRAVPGLVRQYEEAARTPKGSPRPVSDAVHGAEIPDSLVRHFERQGFVLRPAREGNRKREWILENADVGSRCEVVTSFRSFPSGTAVELMTKQLMAVSTPSVLNEHARLAMFYPHARGKTPDKDACEGWSVKSKGIVEPLLEAFRSYRPAS